jgi:hypothetical protein
VALPLQNLESVSSVARRVADPTEATGTEVSAVAQELTSVSAQGTLEALMRQALDVPGAATALLAAFASQARALRLVQEADARGAAVLPVEIRHRLAAVAAETPQWLAVRDSGVRG